MKKLLLVLLFSVMALSLVIGEALATPFSYDVTNDIYSEDVNGIPTANDDNDDGPDINDAINYLLGTAYGNNKDIDLLFVEPDEVWKQLNGGVAVIGLSAGLSDTLGVYIPTGNTNSPKTNIIGPYTGFGFLGDGTASNPYPAAYIDNTVVSTGSYFGFYIHTDKGNYYYSEPSLKSSGIDHMMTFHLTGLASNTIYLDGGSGAYAYTFNDPYLIGWEDLAWDGSTLGDDDYDDIMYVIDKVVPVPEPSTCILILFGFAGIAGIRKKYIS